MQESFSTIAAAGDRTPAVFSLFSLLAFSIAYILRRSEPRSDRGTNCASVAAPAKPKTILPPAFIDELWRIS
jgi:hypothetical protein